VILLLVIVCLVASVTSAVTGVRDRDYVDLAICCMFSILALTVAILSVQGRV
jgi:hypothetical protein